MTRMRRKRPKVSLGSEVVRRGWSFNGCSSQQVVAELRAPVFVRLIMSRRMNLHTKR
jgi:hypothetical protein